MVLLQIVTGCLRGGRIRHFLVPRPIRSLRLVLRPGAYARARDAVWDFVGGLRLPYYFWLGLRGFVGRGAWLVLPVTMLAVGLAAAAGAGRDRGPGRRTVVGHGAGVLAVSAGPLRGRESLAGDVRAAACAASFPARRWPSGRAGVHAGVGVAACTC